MEEDHLVNRIGRTNSILSDVQAHEIRYRLATAETILRRLYVEIRTSKDPADALIRRTRLLNQIEFYTIALAPHKQLPPEILREIFLFCVDDTPSLPPVKNRAPLLLCHISSTWRAVAMKTPQLWKDVFLCPPTNQLDRSLHLAMSNAWLSRTSKCSLSSEMSESKGGKWVPNVIDHFLIPHSHRFQQLYLTLPSDQIARFLTLPGGTFPSLVDVDIESETSNYPVELPDHATVFHALPALRRVSFTAVADFDLRLLKLPWATLTYLSIYFEVDAAVCHDILRQCVALQECRFTVDYIDSPLARKFRSLPTLCLPLLVVCFFGFTESGYIADFFLPLVLPNLRNFELRAGGTRHWPPLFLISFLRPSSHTLERLIIGDPALWRRFKPKGVSETVLETLLECIPSVVHLRLASYDVVSRTALERFSRGEILPRIEDFLFLSPPAQTDFVLEMLEARQNLAAQPLEEPSDPSISKLRTVSLSRYQSREQEERGRALARGGLTIVTYPWLGQI